MLYLFIYVIFIYTKKTQYTFILDAINRSTALKYIYI